jgi:hypothetical protein
VGKITEWYTCDMSERQNNQPIPEQHLKRLHNIFNSALTVEAASTTAIVLTVPFLSEQNNLNIPVRFALAFEGTVLVVSAVTARRISGMIEKAKNSR